MKHVFIVNPTSGKGKGNGFIPAIKKYFEEHRGEYEIITTECPKHAIEIARRYTVEDDVVLYSVGGDGTMKEVIDGLNDGVRICVLPGGTGNDFFKNTTVKDYTEKEIVEAAINGEDIELDYGTVNGTSKFLNIVSFGLDAYINEYSCQVVKVEKKWVPDSLVYLYGVFAVGLHPETYHFKANVDGKEMEDDTILVAVSNGTYYGGMFHAFPEASLTDGKFDCSYFRPVKLSTLFNLIVKYAKGTHKTHPACTAFLAENVHLEFDREIPCQIDGENVRLKVADIQMNAGKIKYRLPKLQ